MNDKVKTLFFSQYLNTNTIVLPCFMSRDETKMCRTSVLTTDLLHVHKTGPAYLLLRDISQLTDEEKINVAMAAGCDRYDDWEDEKLWYGDKWISEFKKYEYQRSCTTKEIFIVSQYLLRIGIILPFCYLSETNQPITLIPAEMIDLGWAKLQSNEQ